MHKSHSEKRRTKGKSCKSKKRKADSLGGVQVGFILSSVAKTKCSS